MVYTQAASAKHMYDSRASKYDDSHHPVFARQLADSLELKPGEKLLDLACGTGLVTLQAAKQVGPTGLVVGVDVSDGMLAELQAKIVANKEMYSNVIIKKHDISKLDSLDFLEKGSFDAISCISALVLLREPGIALQSWIEYLKPGGRLITDATDGQNLPAGTAIEQVYYRLGVDPPYNRQWSKDAASLRRLLQQAGFEVVKEWFNESVGSGTQYHSIDEADERFNNMINTPVNKALVDGGLEEKARPLFKEEWVKLANKDGKIVETDGVHVAIAQKPPTSKPVAEGSCACGAISWEASVRPTLCTNCYCSACRKLSGSPFITFMEFPLSKVRFTPPFGKPHMKTVQISPYAERDFCGECGSSLTMWYKAEADSLSIAVGTLDEDKSAPGLFSGPHQHIYTESIPSWYKIPDDGLPREKTMKGEFKLLGGRT